MMNEEEIAREEEPIAVMMRTEEQIGIAKALCTQTDWSSRVVRETWYGHHSPCGRIFLLAFLSALTGTLVFLPTMFRTMSLLRPMRSDHLQAIRDSHLSCLRSLCTDIREIQFECCRDGTTAHIQGEIQGPSAVPMPTSCIDAVLETFGHGFLNGTDYSSLWNEIGNFDLIRVREDVESDRKAFLRVVPERCTLEKTNDEYALLFNESPDEPDENEPTAIHLHKEDGTKTVRFTEYVCPDEMSPSVQNLLPLVYKCYDVFMRFRLILVPLFLLWVCSLIECFVVVFCWVRVLPATVLISLVLPRPGDVIGFQKITFWRIWKTLCLLTCLTAQQRIAGLSHDVILTLVLIKGSVIYGNKKAAIEWAFLGILMLLAYSDAAGALDDSVRNVNLVQFVGSVIGFFVPGTRWCKLVTIYVFCMAYPKRQILRHNDKND